MRRYYIDAGLPEANLITTGSPSNDAMTLALSEDKARRRSLCADLGLSDDRPLLLTALPPDCLYFPGGRPECDSSYADVVQFWINSIKSVPGYNKVICLHPSVDPETMRFLESDDTKISTRSTYETVPLCDVYVASVSSTIRWAIACGKPVINYDVYRYRYTDYLRLPGVIIIEEQAQFLSLLDRLTSDADFRKGLAEAQEKEAPRWAVFSGSVNDDIASLFARA
jgi:hypothetical protein